MKHLTRSDNKIVAGVLAGIAEYFGLDVSLVRIGFVILVIFTGFFPFGLVYVIAWAIVPQKGTPQNPHVSHETVKEDSSDASNNVSRETL